MEHALLLLADGADGVISLAQIVRESDLPRQIERRFDLVQLAVSQMFDRAMRALPQGPAWLDGVTRWGRSAMARAVSEVQTFGPLSDSCALPMAVLAFLLFRRRRDQQDDDDDEEEEAEESGEEKRLAFACLSAAIEEVKGAVGDRAAVPRVITRAVTCTLHVTF